MTLVFVGKNAQPTYIALSTDVSGDKITGATIKGGSVFLSDTSEWKIIGSDTELLHYSPGGIPLESNKAVPTNIQDQHTPSINSLFSQSLSNFTLASDTPVSTVDTLEYVFEATAGHDMIIGSQIILLDVAGDRFLQAVVIDVATNVITIDRPLDHIYPSATTLGRITTENMGVAGSLATPKIFSVRAGANPADFTQIKLHFLDETAMDDSTFGGIGALTNGLVFRIINSNQTTVFNFKTNSEMKHFGIVEYSTKAKSGQFGLLATFKFAGQSERGVTLRISDNDVIQWVVQDDLTDLIDLHASAIGHETTD